MITESSNNKKDTAKNLLNKFRSRRAVNTLKTVVMILLITYLFSSGKIDIDIFGRFLDKVSLGLILVILSIVLINQLIMAVRQVILINWLNGNLSFFVSFKIILVGFFFNNFLPGGIGGDLIRLHYLKRYSGLSYSESASSVFIDRLLGFVGLGFLTIIVMVFLEITGLIDILHFSKEIILLPIVSTIPLAIICFMFILRSERIFNWLNSIVQRLYWGQQLAIVLSGVKRYMHRRRLLFLITMLGTLSHLAVIGAIAALAYYLIGYEAVVPSLLSAPVVFLASIIPVTPGNIGWTETVAETIFSLFSLEGGAILFILWRCIYSAFSLSGGILYLYMDKLNIPKKEQ